MLTARRVAAPLIALAVAGIGVSLFAAPPSPAQVKAAPPASASQGPAQKPAVVGRVSSPKDEWGHNIGDDYFLANFKQLTAYWRKLEQQTPRVHVKEIGKTSEGRTMLMAIITSPENYAKIDRYRDISRRLGLAEGLTDAQARALAKEGKSVVWIDGGLHADEVLGAQQLIELTYQLASGTDEETMRILRDDIVLAVLVNPDGMDLVSDWYMRNPDPQQRTTSGLPVLYNKYAGHDDNRDFYMSALAESANINKIMYRDWIPQIMYNHHQTGPAGTVMFAPPFRDPFNYNFHPNAVAGIDVVGAMMAQRFITEGKPGVTQRKGAPYSTWFNGGIRTTAHFHNIIGILTETIGNPTPESIPFVTSKALGDSNLWWPIQPQQVWHFRQSIDYSMTANRAILDYASRYREESLYNIYAMGRDEIKWGSEDHWTFTPHKMAKVQEGVVKAGGTAAAIPGAASTLTAGGGRGGGGGRGAGGGAVNPLYTALTTKELRDPRGFIMSAAQPDFGTTTRFINTLIKTGVTVMRATAPFTVAGKSYPANSFIVKTAQAFRPHVMDMFEPQDHPDDIPYPGGPPTPPYDATGYTLAFQMGVQFDRVLDAFDVPGAVKLTDLAPMPTGVVKTAQGPAGYYFSHQANNSFIAINRLLAAGEDVSWLATGPMGPGTFYVASKATTIAIITKAASELGVNFDSTPTAPTGDMKHLKKLRIGLFDQYGGSMPSGWTRLILEQFEFPFEVVYPPDLDKGNLHAKFDVLVFNGGGVAGGRGGGGGAGAGRGGRGGLPIPEPYASRVGSVSAQTMDQVKAFVKDGGTALYIGNATSGAAQAFGIPVTDQVAGLPTDKFYVPGAVLRLAVDNTEPLAHGLGKELDVFFNNDPAFRLAASAANTKKVAWFADKTPLRSGWAWGQEALDQGVAVIDYAAQGQGHVYLFAPEILFRSQPHGAYKLFFNGLYLSTAK